MKPNPKWKFAIGTTSRVPDSGGLHYLIADFDSVDIRIDPTKFGNNIVMQRTPNGWHIYTDVVLPFNILLQKLRQLKADPAWIKIGEKRGYFFLADKSMTVFPGRVERRVIRYGKEKT